MTALLSLRDVVKDYPMGTHVVRALDGVSVDIGRGEFVAVVGASGSGKSTLLHVLGCLDRPTAGEYRLDGEPVHALPPRRLADLRRRRFGFVFQSFHLVGRLTAEENVELPMVFAGTDPAERRRKVSAALEAVGLSARRGHRPDQMSGGERQRVAIARAIVMDPDVILADEPTGNLDSRTGEAIMDLLTGLHAQGRTLVVVTHNEQIAARAGRILRMRDGRLDGGGTP